MYKPYMVGPGNHEASCAEFDDVPYYLSTLLDYNETATPAKAQNLSYWSCPPSQRNFTAYNHRCMLCVIDLYAQVILLT